MKKRRPRGILNREQVVDAALRMLAHDRVERLTIRALARELQAPTMSLYTHFANKEELLDLMYIEIARRMYLDEGHLQWQHELEGLAMRDYALLRENPGWIPLLSRPVAPLDIPLRTRVLKLMTDDGMPTEDAFFALSSVVLLTIGLVLVERSLRTGQGESTIDQRFSKLKRWAEASDGVDQVTQRAVSRLDRFDLSAMHQFAIRRLIRGFGARP